MRRVNVVSAIGGIYSDPQLAWMQAYSTIPKDARWSMAMVLLDTDGVIRQVAREVEPSHACRVIVEMVASLPQDE
jgi:hypothetical protein